MALNHTYLEISCYFLYMSNVQSDIGVYFCFSSSRILIFMYFPPSCVVVFRLNFVLVLRVGALDDRGETDVSAQPETQEFLSNSLHTLQTHCKHTANTLQAHYKHNAKTMQRHCSNATQFIAHCTDTYCTAAMQ